MINVDFLTLIMGAGKTTAAIEYINSHPDKKIIYVTPFTDEVDRIINDCTNFKQPEDIYGTKAMSFDKLITEGSRIATTHKLFLDLNKEDYSMFNDYILILDETIDAVEVLTISRDDVERLIDSDLLKIDKETKRVDWIDSEYTGRFEDLKQASEKGSVILVNNSAFVKEFPVEIFEGFSRTAVLTYLAESSKLLHYFLAKNIFPRMLFLHPEKEQKTLLELRELIEVYEGKHVYKRKIPELSYSWYLKANSQQLNNIGNKVLSFLRSYTKTNNEESIWTTFKDWELKINSKSYIKATFVQHNIRAVNKYRECSVVSYTINRYVNPFVLAYFKQHGVEGFNHDMWSVSELIQLVWRTRIRDGKPIIVQILNKRMRDLFKKYLEGFYTDKV